MDGADLIARHPSDLGDLFLGRAELSVDMFDAPDNEDVPRVHDSNCAEAMRRPHQDAQLFVQFPSDGPTRRFAGFDVPARKAPTPGLRHPVGAADHQVLVASAENADDSTSYPAVSGGRVVLCVVHGFTLPNCRVVLKQVWPVDRPATRPIGQLKADLRQRTGNDAVKDVAKVGPERPVIRRLEKLLVA